MEKLREHRAENKCRSYVRQNVGSLPSGDSSYEEVGSLPSGDSSYEEVGSLPSGDSSYEEVKTVIFRTLVSLSS